MDRVITKIKDAQRALATLHDALSVENPTDLERDGGIQRFEYSFESLWKAAHIYLLEMEKVNAATPRSVFRELCKAQIITEKECTQFLILADDRNRTTHIYLEEIAKKIYQRLHGYSRLMQSLLDRLMQGVGESENDPHPNLDIPHGE